MKKFIFGLALVLSFGLFSNVSAQAAPYEITVNSSSIGTVPRNAVRLPLLEITLKATQPDLAISEFYLIRRGLSTYGDFGSLWVETDDYRRSLHTSFQYDDVARVRFLSPVALPMNFPKRFYVYGNLNFDENSVARNFSIGVQDVKFGQAVFQTFPDRTLFHYDEFPVSSRLGAAKRKQKNYTVRCENRRCYRIMK